FRPAALYNDRAFSHLLRKKYDAREYDAAAADLEEALRLDPGLAAAYYNRAFLALQRWHLDKTRVAIAAAGRDDPVAARPLGLRAPALARAAPTLPLAAGGPGAADEAMHPPPAAVDGGLTPSSIKPAALPRPALERHAGSQELLTRRPAGGRPAGNPRLVL